MLHAVLPFRIPAMMGDRMHRLAVAGCVWAGGCMLGLLPASAAPVVEPTFINPAKHRLLILADMGNEPDEVQQMLHMLMYNNEFDLEGLIAVTGKWLNPQSGEAHRRVLHPELFFQLIDRYEQVLPNLRRHATGWTEPAHLRTLVASGQTGYGIAAAGPDQTSPGSELIRRAILRDDPRPLYIVVNAGSNTLAQALIDLRARHSPAEMDALLARMLVYENGAQDDAGAWIAHEFPAIHWVRSNHQTYGFMGGDGPNACAPYEPTNLGQHHWAREHIQNDHGPLGEHYPDRIFSDKVWSLEGGGTTPWLGLITRGLHDPRHPHWGGWSGRYTAGKQLNVLSHYEDIAAVDATHTPFRVFTDTADRWTDPVDGREYDSNFAPIFRWRRHIIADFQARMDWCVEPPERANHNPVAVVDGHAERRIMKVTTSPGAALSFDASASSDPDAGQTLGFSWWIYPEAGTYHGSVPLAGTDSATVKLTVPTDAGGRQIHLILDVHDDGEIAVMHDYRRIVLDVVEWRVWAAFRLPCGEAALHLNWLRFPMNKLMPDLPPPSRRDLLKTLGVGAMALGGSALTLPSRLSAETEPPSAPSSRNPWIYAFTLGDVEAWMISDGFFVFNQGLDMMYPEKERGAMKRLLEDNHEPSDTLPIYVNIFGDPAWGGGHHF